VLISALPWTRSFNSEHVGFL